MPMQFRLQHCMLIKQHKESQAEWFNYRERTAALHHVTEIHEGYHGLPA